MIHQLTLKVDHIERKNGYEKPVNGDILNDLNAEIERIKHINYEQAEKIG